MLIEPNRTAKAAKKVVLTDICNTIDTNKRSCSLGLHDRIPHGLVAQMVNNVTSVCPWVTRDSINNEYRKRQRQGHFYLNERTGDNPTIIDVTGVAPRTVSPTLTLDVVRARGGRPVGSTNESKQNGKMCYIATKNEIAIQYSLERRAAGKKRLKRGRLDEIISDIKKRNCLPDDFTVDKQLIRQREKTGNIFITQDNGGHLSPLQPVEAKVIATIVQMARIRQCLSPSQGVHLINSMIDGTHVQRELTELKRKFLHGTDGKFG